MKQSHKLGLIITGIIILVSAYNNCGPRFTVKDLKQSQQRIFSRSPGQTCDDALLAAYGKTYQPFLNQSCRSCHISGPGIGAFASPDLATSFASFNSIGADKISNQALRDDHKPPATGSHNTATIQNIRADWTDAQTGYAQCLVDDGGHSSNTYVVKSQKVTVPADITTTTFKRIDWDLQSAPSNAVPLLASIEIRKAEIGTSVKGYEFRNPTLKLKTGVTDSFEARVMNIYINDQLQNEITTYINVNKIISGTSEINLSPSTANAMTVITPAATDMVAIEFQSLKSTSADGGGGGGTGTPTPTPSPTSTPTPTYTQLAASGGAFNSSCFSCHSDTLARGGLNLMNYNAAKTAAGNIKSRINNAANPMPPSGLLDSAKRSAITSWVDGGTPN